MKCRKCGLKAVINMRQHKLALCKEHFLEWIPEQTERFIQKYKMFSRDDKVLVAVSGGKDSLALWDILWRLGYRADGLYIDLGIDGGIGYSSVSKRLAKQFATERELHLIVKDAQESLGASIPDAARKTNRGRGKPCSVCGLTKRHIMNAVAVSGGYTVLATGHNLDDEAAVLFGNTLTWSSGYILRQGPVLPESQGGLAKKVKPLCRFYEREMAAYAILRGIDYIYDECPFAIGAKSIQYKEFLNQLEAKRPGAKLQFYLSFLKAKQEGLFNSAFGVHAEELNECSECGQPTTAPGLCSFCRLSMQVRNSQGVS